MAFSGFEFLIIKTTGDNKNTFDVQSGGSVATQNQVTNHEYRIEALEEQLTHLFEIINSK